MSFQYPGRQLLSLLTAGVLSACMTSYRAEANNTIPNCTASDFKTSDLSVVRVEIDVQRPGTDWPDGCVLRIKANDGTTVAIRLKNVNTKKYRVLIDDKVEERPKEEVPGALAAFLAAGLPAFTRPASQAPTSSATTKEAPPDPEVARRGHLIEALLAFHNTSERLEIVAKALKQALAASESAETYGDLLAEVKAAINPMVAMHPALSACVEKRANPAQCRTGLEGLPEQLEKTSFKPFAEARMAVVEASKVPGASLESTYIAHAVETKYAAAMSMKEKLPAICKEVAAFFDEAGTESSLFTRQQTYDFTGDPTRISVRVESGPEKDAKVKYGMEVRIDPVRVEGFAFSTGFVFAGLSDHDYAVENGKIRRKGDSGPIRPGVGVLAHWRFEGDWALSAGISGSDSDLLYLVGASYLWGSKQRFVVTGGAAVGSVRRLDSVEVDDEFTESVVPTKDVTAIGAFLGVSFKF